MKKVFMRYILPVIGVLAAVFLDQWTKYLTVNEIGTGGRIVLIEDIFELVYVKNNGMAWGLFQNQQLIFIILTPLVLAAVAFLYLRMPYEKKYLPLRILMVMIAGGAIGNLVDRMFRGEFCKGHVVDMFYFKAIDFPVFNVADSFISVAFAVLIVLVLFVYKEEDFDRIFSFAKKKSSQEDQSAQELDADADAKEAAESVEVAKDATKE